MSFLEFEKPIIGLEAKIKELRHLSSDKEINIATEVTKLQAKVDRMLRQTYKKLSAEQKVQVARHPDRPHFLEYTKALFTDFTPLAGDRLFAEDHALLGGVARFKGQPCVIMGHEKGSDTDKRIKHNFGMTRPEGYRKAQRLIDLANRFQLPVITMVDTAGAYPGVGAEERGQSQAIARSIEVFLNAQVPIISYVIGEGGSGGAIAIAAANKVYMLEHAIYSVISPEGCASILWRSGEYARQAAQALKLTAQDLYELEIIDGIIDEPLGAAHRGREDMFINLSDSIENSLKELSTQSEKNLKKMRQEKFLRMGQVT